MLLIGTHLIAMTATSHTRCERYHMNFILVESCCLCYSKISGQLAQSTLWFLTSSDRRTIASADQECLLARTPLWPTIFSLKIFAIKWSVRGYLWPLHNWLLSFQKTSINKSNSISITLLEARKGEGQPSGELGEESGIFLKVEQQTSSLSGDYLSRLPSLWYN